MEIIEVTVFSFDELGDEAKEKARSWYREGLEYPWFNESLASIRAFVEHFGGSLTNWSLGSGSGRDYLKTDIGASNFRGLKLKDFSPDNMPTGYCLDCDLWGTFHKEWKQTSDPLYAFQQALEAAICAVQRDIDYQFSDECIDETLKINEYQFLETGKVF